jgi:hypothetical protein
MGIAKILKSGKIRLNVIDKKIEIIDTQDFIAYNCLNASDGDMFIEKYVGQVLEEEGWEVNYQGLKNGFSDRGIDLIAYKDGAVNAIQCKYVTSFLTKSKIEWILYKVSKLLDETCSKYPKKTSFTLIVSDVELSFQKEEKKFQSNIFRHCKNRVSAFTILFWTTITFKTRSNSIFVR